jgi:hypothetical protein
VAAAAISSASAAMAMWPGYRLVNPQTIRKFLIDRPLGRLGLVAIPAP